MAYVKTDWQTGDIITVDKLNHMEQGIADYQVGPKGDPGTPGADGAKGDPGSAATIAVGTVSTGAAGSSATVTNSGTTSAAVLDFSIPQGAKGDTGAKGADGAPGKGIKSIALTTDSSGKVTGGTLTFSDDTTEAITVTVAGA